MAILFFADGVKKPKLKYNIINFWLSSIVLSYNSITCELNYIFCNDKYLLDINTRYLNHDFYTDVITFDYCLGNNISGDIFISIERVKENAVIYNVNFEDELMRVIVHGLLHLLGFNDSSLDEKGEMRKMEDELLLMLQSVEYGRFK